MGKPKTIYLRDYREPDFLIDHVELCFEIKERSTIVTSELKIRRNGRHERDLVLDGEELELLSVAIDDNVLASKHYHTASANLTIPDVPSSFKLQIKVRIYPHKNTSLDGLYKSGGNFCTQCEPTGFRRITYYLDRPDVMSQFTTTIIAPKKYPILLSNGNLIAKGDKGSQQHWAKWSDPSLKPSYLFALVAGDFDCLTDKYTTKSDRLITIKFYVDKGYKKQTRYALESLKRAMRWDETVFGLEYDLNIYMVVAIGDFNVGAMENKGLNIFNTKYILADAKTATDRDYISIENVIGHEYFHNWTGNRITCRDWFQITLKEGLTMFRDQQFSADMTSAAVKRINDVSVLRSQQFAEDSGAMSHPVQPQSYIDINNFYTVTVYNKGAEIIRMFYTFLGAKKFYQGMRLYVKRHDGQAITVNEFIQAMQDASGIDLKQFKRWYQQHGTPKVSVKSNYDAKKQLYTLELQQQGNLHIPILVGLVDKDGNDMKLELLGDDGNKATTKVLSLTEKQQEFRFSDVKEQPVPSLLRQFSAPIILDYSYRDEELYFLMQHDSDTFNRWEAGQKMAEKIISRLVDQHKHRKNIVVPELYIETLRQILTQKKIEDALLAQMLTMPDIKYLIERLVNSDIDSIYFVTEFLKQSIAIALKDELVECYSSRLTTARYQIDSAGIGARSLKNIALYYLLYTNDKECFELCKKQYKAANNMTDVIGSLRAIVDYDVPLRDTLFADFYQHWQHEPLVINKWLELQALAKTPDVLSTVKELVKSSCFNLKNPNKVFALIRTFSGSNLVRFHDISGAGYRFLADQVLKLDRYNPQVAARIAQPLLQWHKYDAKRQQLMEEQIARIKRSAKLSKNLYEVINK